MITCSYADLFDQCQTTATRVIRWRRWGRVPYCEKHYLDLTHDNPSDLMELITL